MALPSDEFKIAETNALLARVPGMSAMMPTVAKTVGGNGGQVDPQTLQVEDTNSAVMKIVGAGFIKEQLGGAGQSQSRKRKVLREDGMDALQQALDAVKAAAPGILAARPDQELPLQDLMADLGLLIKAVSGA